MKWSDVILGGFGGVLALVGLYWIFGYILPMPSNYWNDVFAIFILFSGFIFLIIGLVAEERARTRIDWLMVLVAELFLAIATLFVVGMIFLLVYHLFWTLLAILLIVLFCWALSLNPREFDQEDERDDIASM